MRFEVPQFIEVEDKIIGPFSFRQFVYIGGSAGFVIMLYLNLPIFFTILLGAPVVALGVALAFYKVNDRPFILVLEAAMNYIRKKKLYLWKQTKKQIEKKEEESLPNTTVVPKISQNKLKDLAWSLDIEESMYSDGSQRQ